MNPVSYETSLSKTKADFLITGGSGANAFRTEGIEQGILPYKPDANISVIEGGTHLGIIMSERAMFEVVQWIVKKRRLPEYDFQFGRI
jgi:hypothetical protein